MNTIVLTAIAEELVLLERLVDAQTGELGYGTDLSCTTDITEDLAEVDPNSTEGIAQAAIRRQTCPRGGLPDDSDYGIDVRSYANRGSTQEDLRHLGGQLRGELRKDDRIEDVEITTTFANGSLCIVERIIPADSLLTPFTLTLAVTDGEVLLESIT